MKESRFRRNMLAGKFSVLFIGVGVVILLEMHRASKHDG
jgi:hypothetical protein